MKNTILGKTILLAGVLGVSAAIPAWSANIDYISISNNSGIWNTDGSFSVIGITNTGSNSNAFLNDGFTLSLASGTYLAFMGFESYWYGYGEGTPITLSLYYDNSTVKTGTFAYDNLNNAEHWYQISGDSGIYLGGSGYTDNNSSGVDRIGNGTAAFGSNGSSDAILEFSDTGSFGRQGPAPAGSAPEPSSLLLAAGGLLAAGWKLRRA